MDTKLTGDLSEMMVVVELLRREFRVLEPVGDRLPYDIALDVDGRLIRLQVRTAYGSNGHFVGNVRNAKTNRKEYSFVLSDTANVEFFVFVVQAIPAFYVVPSSVVKMYRSGITFRPGAKRSNKRVHCDPEDFKDRFDLIK